MSYALKPFMFAFYLLILSFILFDFNQLEAACGRWSTYDNSRGAWGGNGGWWGDSRENWYSEYGTSEDHSHYHQYASLRHPNRYGRQGYTNGRAYRELYYGESIDGGALYLNFR